MPRTLATLAIALVVLVVGAAPASAHSVSGVGANNFQTRLTAVSPALPGIEVSVIELGSRLQLVNTTSDDVIVMGYQDDEYLRVGPSGVFVNVKSPATYLNASRKGQSVPGTADPRAEPEWRRVDGGHVARWHDHRIHWMSSQTPPEAKRDPDHAHVLVRWEVPIRAGARDATIRGTLRWAPSHSAVPWLAGAVALLVAVALLGRARRPWRAFAVVAVVLAVLDVAHAAGVGWLKAGGLTDKLGQTLASSPYTCVSVVVGVVAVALLVREAFAGLAAALVLGVLLAVLGGYGDRADLTRPEVPFAWSIALDRAIVTVSLGAGIGLAIAAYLALRQQLVVRARRAASRATT